MKSILTSIRRPQIWFLALVLAASTWSAGPARAMGRIRTHVNMEVNRSDE